MVLAWIMLRDRADLRLLPVFNSTSHMAKLIMNQIRSFRGGRSELFRAVPASSRLRVYNPIVAKLRDQNPQRRAFTGLVMCFETSLHLPLHAPGRVTSYDDIHNVVCQRNDIVFLREAI